MESNRLKMKVGDHEFEAEGDPKTVDAQLQAFRELVAMSLKVLRENPPPAPEKTPDPIMTVVAPPDSGVVMKGMNVTLLEDSLPKIMKVEDRVVSLTARARNVDEATLLIVYGQKVLRNSDSVTGYEVVQGLATTGQRVARADRVLDKHARDGNIIIVGERRARRYRLSNLGQDKAREIAANLIATVA